VALGVIGFALAIAVVGASIGALGGDDESATADLPNATTTAPKRTTSTTAPRRPTTTVPRTTTTPAPLKGTRANPFDLNDGSTLQIPNQFTSLWFGNLRSVDPNNVLSEYADPLQPGWGVMAVDVRAELDPNMNDTYSPMSLAWSVGLTGTTGQVYDESPSIAYDRPELNDLTDKPDVLPPAVVEGTIYLLVGPGEANFVLIYNDDQYIIPQGSVDA
jgi:hypothetical protein